MSWGHESVERAELAKAYPGPAWREKVRNMSDAQVHAVAVSLRNRREKERNSARNRSHWLPKNGGKT